MQKTKKHAKKTIIDRARDYADRHELAEMEFRGLSELYSYARIYNAEITAYANIAKELILAIEKRHKYLIMKEIHFYTNLNNVEQTSDWDLENMCVDYVSTQSMIDSPNVERVKTTQLSFLLNTWDYIDKGYKVYIHNGMEVFEVREHMDNTYSGKDIRKGHNMLRVLIGGTLGKIE